MLKLFVLLIICIIIQGLLKDMDKRLLAKSEITYFKVSHDLVPLVGWGKHGEDFMAFFHNLKCKDKKFEQIFCYYIH